MIYELRGLTQFSRLHLSRTLRIIFFSVASDWLRELYTMYVRTYSSRVISRFNELTVSGVGINFYRSYLDRANTREIYEDRSLSLFPRCPARTFFHVHQFFLLP